MLEIKRKISSYNHYDYNTPTYIIIHYVGANSSAKNNVDYFYNGDRQASAHLFIDDNECWQSVEFENGAWHIGNSVTAPNNTNSIGIEMCLINGVVSETTENNTIEIVRYLMGRYNIPIENVRTHAEVTNYAKICPNWSNNNWARWKSFKNKITNYNLPKAQVKWINVEGDFNPNKQLKISASTEKNGDWYKFWACNRETNEWIMVQDWSRTYNYAYFTPKSEGKHTFVAWVKNGANSNVVSETEEDTYTSVDKYISNPSKINSITVNTDKITQNDNIIFTVNGTSNSLYKYFICDRNKNIWSDLEGGKWIDKNSTSFSATNDSTYTFVAWIKNKNSCKDTEDDYKGYDFKVIGKDECTHNAEIEKLKIENEQLEKEVKQLRDKISKANQILK